jgi:hypothetical protein
VGEPAGAPEIRGGLSPAGPGLDGHALGYEGYRTVPGERATHLFLRKCG